MSPGRQENTRQIRRAERRRKEKILSTGGYVGWQAGDGSGSMSRWEAFLAILCALGALLLTGIAWAVDLRAFQAVATPVLYCWIILCGAVVIAGVTAVAAARVRLYVPWYFRVVLIAGAIMGVFMVKPAWRILTKDRPESTASFPATNIDFRNRVITDKSFAERNLRRAELSGVTFHHVDLSGADLSEADLRNARFEDVELSGATLCGVDLRGADLHGAHDVDAVADWSYVFYDKQTRVPRSRGFVFSLAPGPIPDTGRDLLYMCKRDKVRRIDG
jgi:pentapeptide repeat protein